MAITKQTLIKIIELVLVIILVILDYTTLLGAGIFLGYLIILIGLLIGLLLDTPVDKRVDMFYSICGCVLFILIGVNYIQGTSSNDDKTKGYLSIVTGIIFLVDAVLVITNQMGS